MSSPLFAPDNRAAPITEGPGRASAPAAVEPNSPAVLTPHLRLGAGDPVLGYVSAPTDPDGTGIRASTRAVELACDRAGWQLIDMFHDLKRYRTMRRPGLFEALEQIADGNARGLVVSQARLLGNSITDLAQVLSWFRDARAVFIALDLGLDTSTPAGSRVAMALIRLSGWDRGTVANGKPRDLAELDSRDESTRHAVNGHHAGLLARISAMHEDDVSLQEMADQLNADGVPTMNGGDRWWPSSVRTALRYARGEAVRPADVLPSLEVRMRS
jgi:Resolvase, N terminal domain